MRKVVRINESKMMKCGLVATITRYNNNKDIDVTFENGLIVCNAHYAQFEKGTLKCPMIYNIKDDYVECININLNPIVKFLIDLETLKIVLDLNAFWCTDGKGYIKNKKTYLHRYIMNCPQGMVVDHINMNRSDYRKCNLRICTNGENLYNQNKYRNNKSGYKGVSWNTACNKWKAEIRANNKIIHLGYYSDIQDAATAYNEAALIYHGEYARLNVVLEV